MARSVDGVHEVTLARLDHPMCVRTGTPDLAAVIDAAVREEYGVGLPPNLRPLSMIDAGAYIGDTGAYFLSRFPDLKLLALEPNQDNYELACINLARYGPRSRVMNAALWVESGTLQFEGEFLSGEVGQRGVSVKAISILDALDALPEGRVDILKMDIEGAEREIFRKSPAGWLHRVGHILIELHGEDIAREVLPVNRGAGFSCTRFRSVWCCHSGAMGCEEYG